MHSTDASRSSPAPGAGLGREHALLFASEGAKVVVNDLGGDMHGEGGDPSSAMQTVDDIKAMGGEAVVNGDNVADWDGAQRMVQQAVDDVRRPAHPREQRRHPPRPRDHQHDRGRVGRGDRRAPEGSLLPDAPRRRVLARADQGGQGRERVDRAHVVDVGAVLESRARPTTARRRPASRRSRRSAPRSSSRYGVRSNAIAPAARDPPDRGDARACRRS